jgi:hypothetical protein
MRGRVKLGTEHFGNFGLRIADLKKHTAQVK